YDVHYGSPRPAGAEWSSGVLEGTYGVIVRGNKKLVRACSEASISSVDHNAVNWLRIDIPEMVWTHFAMMEILQGKSIAQVLAPLRVLQISTSPIWSPRPVARDVVLAKVYSAPVGTSELELYQHLMATMG